jgi:hypothetical protein
LGIPYAFARAGFLLCSLILLVVTLLSYLTVMWVAETGARFEEHCKRATELKTEQTHLLHHVNELGGRQPRYEVIDLIQFYLGGFHKMIYQLSLMALMCIGLLAYSQVFCGAIAALLPENGVLVGLPQLIFGIMVVPLSCMDLEEQLSMQSLMAAVRFVAIAVVVFGSLFALLVDSSHSFRDRPPFFATPEADGCKMSYVACFDGFGIAFSTCMFSQLFQHSIPGLLRPLSDQPQQLQKAPVREKTQVLHAPLSTIADPLSTRIIKGDICGVIVDHVQFLFPPWLISSVIFWCCDKVIHQLEFCRFCIWFGSHQSTSLDDYRSAFTVIRGRHFSGFGYNQRVPIDCQYVGK